MNEPWYGSQIAGVVIGAILGFLISFVTKKIEEVVLRSKLKKALKADITSIVNATIHSLPVVSDSLEALKNDRPCAIYTTNPGPSKVFEANLSNVGILEESLIEEIISFYSLVEKTRSNLISNAEVLEKFNIGSIKVIDKNFVVQGFTGLVKIHEQVIADGPELIKRLKKT